MVPSGGQGTETRALDSGHLQNPTGDRFVNVSDLHNLEKSTLVTCELDTMKRNLGLGIKMSWVLILAHL